MLANTTQYADDAQVLKPFHCFNSFLAQVYNSLLVICQSQIIPSMLPAFWLNFDEICCWLTCVICIVIIFLKFIVNIVRLQTDIMVREDIFDIRPTYVCMRASVQVIIDNNKQDFTVITLLQAMYK